MSLFNNATLPQIQALARCGTPEMAPLTDLLTSVMARVSDHLASAEAAYQVHRLQGEYAVLKDLLLSIKKAPEALARLS